GLAACIDDHLRMANLLADWMREDKRFELSAPVVMRVVCFRFTGAGKIDTVAGVADAGPRSATAATMHKLDMINSKIVEHINASGRAYLTQTNLRGRTVMRIGLGNILTTEQHLRNVWEMIRDEVEGRALSR